MPVTHDAVQHESTLSDAFLRQLMAVGQVDILVGLPTLDNAATIIDVVRAIHLCFTRDFPRLRTVMINSDGGSTDGTPELIRAASFTEADMVQTSHSLRTLHRVVAPYHGLPGKLTALRTIFAAAELTQAKVLVIVDPDGPATSPERVTELITPIPRSEVEFLAPRYRRHPRDGVLVTQLVRPLVRALYGVALDEPLGVEFSCSGRFASHCLDQDIWNHEVGEVRDRPVAAYRGGRRGRADGSDLAAGRPTGTGARTTLREAVQQVVLSLVESLRAHHSFWLAANGVTDLRTWGKTHGRCPTRRPGTTRRLPSRRVTTSSRSGPCSRKCSNRRCSRESSTKSRRRHSPRRRALGRDRVRVRRRRATRHRPASSIWLACSCRSTCGARRHSWRTRRARRRRPCRHDSIRSVRHFSG